MDVTAIAATATQMSQARTANAVQLAVLKLAMNVEAQAGLHCHDDGVFPQPLARAQDEQGVVGQLDVLLVAIGEADEPRDAPEAGHVR